MRKYFVFVGLIALSACRDNNDNNISVGLNKNAATTNTSSISLATVDYKTWMGGMDDSTLLKDITLVGSHDAGAYRNGGGLAICQQDDISTQLANGVRYFDIRLNADMNKNDLIVYHGIISQDLSFSKDVLPAFINFLKANPSETVFVVLKNESGNNQTEWASMVRKQIASYEDYLLRKISLNTTLAEARKKIIFISRSGMDGEISTFKNIRYNTSDFATLNGQPAYYSDQFQVPTLLANDINNKTQVLYDAIYKAQQEVNKDSWVIANANGTSVLAYPYDVAYRINPMIDNYLSSHITNPYNYTPEANFISKRSGFIVLDFSTSDSGKKVIAQCVAQSLKVNNIQTATSLGLKPGFVK